MIIISYFNRLWDSINRDFRELSVCICASTRSRYDNKKASLRVQHCSFIRKQHIQQEFICSFIRKQHSAKHSLQLHRKAARFDYVTVAEKRLCITYQFEFASISHSYHSNLHRSIHWSWRNIHKFLRAFIDQFIDRDEVFINFFIKSPD